MQWGRSMLTDIITIDEILRNLAGMASIGIVGILLSDIKITRPRRASSAAREQKKAP